MDSCLTRLDTLCFAGRSRPRCLAVTGGLLLALCFIIETLSCDFAATVPNEARPVFLTTALWGVAFLLYLAGVTLVWNWRGWPAARSLFMWAVLFRTVLLWSEPILEVDIYRYLWDGQVIRSGVSPYRFTPAEVAIAPADSASDEPFGRLVRLRDSSPARSKMLSRVHYPEIPTIYPPASQVVFALAAMITPRQAGLTAHVRVMKFLLLLFDLGTVLLLMSLLTRMGRPPAQALIYAWCPLVLKEFANSGHLDCIAVFLVVLTLRLLLAVRPGQDESGSVNRAAGLASVAWAGATLAKLYPVVLFPVVARYLWRQIGRRAFVPLGIYAGLTVTVLALCAGGRNGSNSVDGSSPGGDPLAGTRTFFSEWEMNDFVFMTLYENIRVRKAGPEAAPWFVVVPDRIRSALAAGAGSVFGRGGRSAAAPSFIAAQCLVGALLILICIHLAWRPDQLTEESRLLETGFLSLAALWYLSATQNPWYWTWALPLIPFARHPVWLLVSGLAFIYYLRFGLIYQFAEGTAWTGGLSGQECFDQVIVWFEHLPVLVVLLLAGRWTKAVPIAEEKLSV